MSNEFSEPAVLFSTAQLATLHAMINRIIPPDEFPSGWDAGVGVYLARQLNRDLQPQLTPYRAGLDALDAEAQSFAGARFAALPPATQDDLLSRIEAGQVTTQWPDDPAVFFTMVVTHAMEGYYSDPGNGGNDHAVSWRMIGFEARG